MWHVIVRPPQETPWRKVVGEGCTLQLGRSLDNDIVLHDERVSRRHAQLAISRHGVRVADLQSRNGTLLNGLLVGKVARSLHSGDELRIGDFVIQVEDDGIKDGYAQPGRDTVAPQAEGFVTLMSSPVIESSVAEAPTFVHFGPGRSFALLFELAQALAQGAPPEDMGQQLLQCAISVTGFEDSAILERRAGDFHPRFLGENSERPFHFSQGLVELSLRKQATLFVHHLPSDARFQTGSAVQSSALHVICAPLFPAGLPLGPAQGALYLSTRSANVPTQLTIDFVTTLGQLVTTVLQRLNGSPASSGVGESVSTERPVP